ncbi:uncharacterized protein LOC135384662 [Ornithodoros turicata]|uniref:uncharacterized protein LOC135384662 n=1 Tax=Ornithodoros turicata TaxID=34597 RepID=UPI00313A15D2
MASQEVLSLTERSRNMTVQDSQPVHQRNASAAEEFTYRTTVRFDTQYAITANNGATSKVCQKKAKARRSPTTQKSSSGRPDGHRRGRGADVYGVFQITAEEPTVRVSVEVNGQPLEMEVDSGAPTGVEGIGFHYTVNVCYKGRQERLRLVVVKGAGVSLLGRDWFKALGIEVKIHRLDAGVKNLGSSTTPVLRKYAKVFQPGLGKSKGPPVRVEVEPTAQPKFYKRYMEELLQGLDGVQVYLDDILVGGKNEEEHNTRLEAVLRRILEDGVRLNKDKCLFGVKEVVFLGHKIRAGGIQPTDDKVKAIHDAPAPNSKMELQAFLGALNFYNRFLRGAAHTLEPLYRLLDAQSKWKWTGREATAFQQAKQLLQSSDILVHYDVQKALVMACDASPYGLGVVLSHVEADPSKPQTSVRHTRKIQTSKTFGMSTHRTSNRPSTSSERRVVDVGYVSRTYTFAPGYVLTTPVLPC